MNADDNPLDFVWATFKTTRDCLKVADKVRTQANVNWLQKTDFIPQIQEVLGVAKFLEYAEDGEILFI